MVLPLLLPQICLLSLTIFISFYIFYLSRIYYWRWRGIPSPPGARPFSGHLDQMFWDVNFRLFQLSKWTEQFGNTYGVLFGWTPMLVVAEPDMVHELLSKKFEQFHGRFVTPLIGDPDTQPRMHLFNAQGARWKRLRATATPAFSINSLKKVMPTMDNSIQVAVNLIEQARLQNPDKSINLHRYFVEMTYDVIARVAMGQRESRQFRNEDAKLAVLAFQRFYNNWFDYVAQICPFLGRYLIRPFLLMTGRLRKDPFALLFLKNMETIKERKIEREEKLGRKTEQGFDQGPVPPMDFIDLFLDTEIEQEQLEICKQQNSGAFIKSKAKIQRSLTLVEMLMQLQLFLLAGFDTTSNSLGFICYNLAKYPEVQSKVREEIEAVCPNESPTYEQLKQLKYTEAVIRETLRLFPIGGSVVNRVCAETTKLGEYTVKKGEVVQVDTYSIHRDKSVWGEDAKEFRPERWFEGVRLAHFYGFGAGPRICIGMDFALLEVKMTLVRLLRQYALIETEEMEKELKFSSQMVLNPGAVYLGLKKIRR